MNNNLIRKSDLEVAISRINSLLSDVNAEIQRVEGEIPSDSGWVDCTINEDFKPYNDSATNRPQVRKIGNVVYLRGAMSPKVAFTPSSTSAEYTMFSIPSGYRPTNSNNVLICQGSNMNKWTLRVKSNGDATLRSYGIDSVVSISASVWLVFTMSYLVG